MPAERPPSPDRRRLLVALGYGAANVAVLGRWLRRNESPGTAGRSPEAAEVDRSTVRGTATEPDTTTPTPPPADDHVYDLVITGGRVIDSETGRDEIANVGIDGPTITSITTAPLRGRRRIDATGKVVSAGFIDLLSYEPDDYGARYKVADGVTTNLGMHGINARSADFFRRYDGACIVHYGGAFDDPWVRSTVLDIPPGEAASRAQIGQLVDECERQLREGWIGVDIEPEYTPGIHFDEMKALAEVARRHDVPVFVHGRFSAVGTNAATLDEILEVAKQTGARVHVEHLISTGGTFDMANSLRRLQGARDAGYDVTACMYPYDFWATYLGSPRFNPGWQERFRISYDDLQVAGTSERLTEATFRQHQLTNRLAAAFAIPEADVRECLRDPHVMIGSDAILTTGNNHPRATGCFARTLGKYARDDKVIDLPSALAKMTILPARRLEAAAPALRRKGRMQPGADADVTVFDPATVSDRSTIENPAQYSQGIEWVLVLGQVVKDPDGFDDGARPGRPVMFRRA